MKDLIFKIAMTLLVISFLTLSIALIVGNELLASIATIIIMAIAIGVMLFLVWFY